MFGDHPDPLRQRQTQKHELLSQAVHTLRVELLRPVLREAASSLRRPEQVQSRRVRSGHPNPRPSRRGDPHADSGLQLGWLSCSWPSARSRSPGHVAASPGAPGSLTQSTKNDNLVSARPSKSTLQEEVQPRPPARDAKIPTKMRFGQVLGFPGAGLWTTIPSVWVS